MGWPDVDGSILSAKHNIDNKIPMGLLHVELAFERVAIELEDDLIERFVLAQRELCRLHGVTGDPLKVEAASRSWSRG